jgi:hypothetical protein
MTARKKTAKAETAKVPATYDDWMQSLSAEDRMAEYKRNADVYEHRKAYNECAALERTLSEQALPDALIGARFVARDDDEARESFAIGYKSFYVVGQVGRYYRQIHTRRDGAPEAFLHGRGVMIMLDPETFPESTNDPLSTIGLAEFFNEIAFSYRLDLDETTPAPAFIQRLRRR